jgi:hypothetical protein
VDKYNEITNNWNYDASCTITSLPVWYLENFKRLIFVVQGVHAPFLRRYGIKQDRKGAIRTGFTQIYYTLSFQLGILNDPRCFEWL